jgi:hypothetical protein
LRVLWVLLKYKIYLTFIVGFVAFFALLINFVVRNFETKYTTGYASVSEKDNL